MTNASPQKPPRRHRMRWVAAAVVLGGFFAGSSSLGKLAIDAVRLQEDPWAPLIAAIDASVSDYDGQVGIYMKDLKTGRVYARNADERFASASLIKVPIMAAAFQAVRDGSLDLDSEMTLSSHHRRGGSGRLKWKRAGTRFSVSSIIYRMITDSDNTATAMMIDRLGYRYLNRAFGDLGLKTMRIDPVGMSLSDRIHPARENYTTPREMGYLFEKIYRRELVSDGLSDLMLEVLKGAASPTRLGRFLPDDWRFARKTGLLRMNCHDVGIVFAESGDYVLCVLTRENHTYREAKGLIASVGKMAYGFMGQS